MSQPLTPAPLLPKFPSVTGKMIGGTMLVGGAGMIVSGIVEFAYRGDETQELAIAALLVTLVGFALVKLTEIPAKLNRSSVFLAVTLSWLAFSVIATLPYLFTGTFTRFDDALFESISGFTTTGATLLTGIDALPEGVKLWRSMTQWFGGIGVIVVLVSIVPVFGIGGLSLLEAEAPGPESERLVPRIRETAQRLVAVYLSLTALIFVSYLVFGMGPFDAVNHAFTTISTGGFSTHDASFAYFDSPRLEAVAILGMVLAGGNFILWYRLATGKPGPLLKSTEFRAWIAVMGGATLLVWAWNLAPGGARSNIPDELFTVVSISTTTGYTVSDFTTWSGGAQALLLLLMPLGAMSGSTAGGFKVSRGLAVTGFLSREVIRQVHPRIVRVVTVNGRPVDEDSLRRIAGFFIIYAVLWAGGFIAVDATGPDLTESISTVASSLGNVGPALGTAGPGVYDVIPRTGRILLMAYMLIGRLEVFPPLIATWTVYDMLRRRKFQRRFKRMRENRKPRTHPRALRR